MDVYSFMDSRSLQTSLHRFSSATNLLLEGYVKECWRIDHGPPIMLPNLVSLSLTSRDDEEQIPDDPTNLAGMFSFFRCPALETMHFRNPARTQMAVMLMTLSTSGLQWHYPKLHSLSITSMNGEDTFSFFDPHFINCLPEISSITLHMSESEPQTSTLTCAFHLDGVLLHREDKWASLKEIIISTLAVNPFISILKTFASATRPVIKLRINSNTVSKLSQDEREELLLHDRFSLDWSDAKASSDSND